MHAVIFEPYEKAAHLLDDPNLVWSSDLDAIRKPLAYSLTECAVMQILNPWLLEIAWNIITEAKRDA
jgi:hypothetical protein